MSRLLRLAALAAIAVTLGACRIDTTVTVAVDPEGSGTVTVTAVADAAVVQQAPGLADDLRFDDAVAAGWVVDGPTPTDDGGLTVSVSHPFATVEEATALLMSINGSAGPLHEVSVGRTVTADDVTTSVTGVGRIDGGLDAFADPDVLTAIGGSPYANDIAAAGGIPSGAVTVTLQTRLPGQTAGATTAADGTRTVSIPLDGTSVDLATTSVVALGTPGGTWNTVATVALVALVAWSVVALGFIAFVVVARRRRAQRRGRHGSVG